MNIPVLNSVPEPEIAEMQEVQLDQNRLISLARDGDGDAFCTLIRPLESRLLGQAAAFCGQLDLAEDLVQETLVEAWKNLHRYNGTCRLFTWLYAIMLARYRKFLRKSNREPKAFSEFSCDIGQWLNEHGNHTADESLSPGEIQIQFERAKLLRECLERLPFKNRQVVLLRFYGDASLDEISDVLRCSTGTVKSRLFYALEKLRKMNIDRNAL